MVSLFQPRKRTLEFQLAHVLRTVPLFAEVPAADLVAIWRRLVELELPAGTVLFQRGDPGDRFYMVQAGALEVRLGVDPDGLVLRHAGPGDALGEMALLTGQPRSA